MLHVLPRSCRQGRSQVYRSYFVRHNRGILILTNVEHQPDDNHTNKPKQTKPLFFFSFTRRNDGHVTLPSFSLSPFLIHRVCVPFVLCQAFCSISTGVYGYPIYDATHIALDVTRSFVDSSRGSSVRCLFSFPSTQAGTNPSSAHVN